MDELKQAARLLMLAAEKIEKDTNYSHISGLVGVILQNTATMIYNINARL
jgi:hypothetical protein